MTHPMFGKTWGENLRWRQELQEGKRPATIYDVEWLLIELKITEDKFRYYLNK